MTRKDYRVIASALYASKPDSRDTLSYLQWELTVQVMCDSLMYTSPVFNPSRFSDACYTGKD